MTTADTLFSSPATPLQAADIPLRKPMRGYLTATVIFIASWIVLSLPWLIGSLTIPYDAKAHFQAQIQFLANALHTNQSPMWSPHVFVGTPHIADPQSLIFSPAYILAWFEAIPSFRDLDIYVLLLLGCGGLAILALCRDRGWHPAGGLVAAIIFAFGASAAWRIQHIGQVQSYAFFALSLWLMVRALDRASIVYGILAGLSIGAMIIEPDQVALLGCYVLAGVVIGHWWQQNWSLDAFLRTLPPLVFAAIAMIVLAGLPLLMTTLYAASSNRPAIEFAEAVRGSLHPASLLTAVVGDLYGALDPKVPFWGPHSYDWDPNFMGLSQNMSQVYIGALPILLMLTVGVGRGLLKDREIRPSVIILVMLILYALGAWTPVFGFLYTILPGVAIFRRPADATFLIGAMGGLTAGYLVHCWATRATPPASQRQRFIEAAIIASLFAISIIIAIHEQRFGQAWQPILFAAAWIGASCVLLLARDWRMMARPALVIAAPAILLTGDLAWNNGPNESTALPTANYEILKPNCRNTTIRFLKERMRRQPGSQWRDRVELVGLGFEWPNAAMIHGIDHTLGYNPLRIGTVSRALGAGDTIAGPDQREFSPLFPSYRSRLADLLGLRFIATPVPIEKIDPDLQRGDLNLIARTSDAYIYENPDALPRVMIASSWQRADFSKMMITGQWPKFDPRQTVLLEHGVASAGEKATDLPDSILNEQSAIIFTYENTVVEIEVETDRPGLLVLNDAWHPWWTAEVDGKETEVLRANVLFRAVEVPAGRHFVRFEFKPFSGAVQELSEKLFGPEPLPVRTQSTAAVPLDKAPMPQPRAQPAAPVLSDWW